MGSPLTQHERKEVSDAHLETLAFHPEYKHSLHITHE